VLACRIYGDSSPVVFVGSSNERRKLTYLAFTSLKSILFGILLAGGIASPANPTYTTEELKHQLKDSTASFMITIEPFADRAVAAASTAKIDSKKIFVLGGPVQGTTPFVALMKNAGDKLKKYQNGANDVAVIPYSSGTTGLPKGVMLTHKNLVANIIQVRSMTADSVGPKDSFAGILPFFHIYGLVVTLMVGVCVGCSVFVMPKFELDVFLKTIQEQKLTTLHLVPPIILALAKAPVVSKFDLSSIRIIMSGAAPLGPEISKALVARLPNVRLRQGYGMTELSPVSHFQKHDDIVFGSIGPLLCNQQCMIVDPETLKSLPQGQVGEVWVKGPNVMKGYWRRPDATSAMVTEDGWLRTGDLGMITADGHYWIVDRLKELIKYKGFQVPPAELEELLLSHPDVADCAVLGVPDDAAGELPKAYVVLKPGVKITEQDIQKFAASKLAPHKHLRGGVQFTQAIPKSASGKILRRVLKEEDAKARKAKL
jgi:acyl-CoA synthetase (AMP-forming)/AMP-acid ligase II